MITCGHSGDRPAIGGESRGACAYDCYIYIELFISVFLDLHAIAAGFLMHREARPAR